MCCSETYEYYKLPYCKPKAGVRYKTLGMGEVVDANRMATTPYQLNFKTDRKDEVICEKTLSDDDMAKFRKVSRPAGPEGLLLMLWQWQLRLGASILAAAMA